VDQTSPTPISKRRVLCIEDERFIGELYARAIQKAGYDIKVVIDGREGLKEAQTNHYDIILLDLMIPNMTGMEILKELRNPSQSTLKAKIIITTNLEQKEETRAAIEQQADGYLIKAEITPRQLVSILDSIN
jgi:DNA-binding response OmpR family regulator